MMITSKSFVIHSFVLIVFLKKSYFFTLTNDRIEYWLFQFCFLKLNIVFKQSKQKNVFKRRWRQAIEYIQRSSQKNNINNVQTKSNQTQPIKQNFFLLLSIYNNIRIRKWLIQKFIAISHCSMAVLCVQKWNNKRMFVDNKIFFRFVFA